MENRENFRVAHIKENKIRYNSLRELQENSETYNKMKEQGSIVTENITTDKENTIARSNT